MECAYTSGVVFKTHSAGQHDYPQFLADWSKLLTERGAVVNGALHLLRSADLEDTDVVVVYKGDAGYLSRRPKGRARSVCQTWWRSGQLT